MNKKNKVKPVPSVRDSKKIKNTKVTVLIAPKALTNLTQFKADCITHNKS